MANARVTEITPAVPAVTGIVLELTMKEATFINILMDCIGGDPYISSRKHAVAINMALNAAGIAYHVKGDTEGLTEKGAIFHTLNRNAAKIDIHFDNKLPVD